MDDTLVMLSAKLFAAGLKIGPDPSKRLVKFSIGVKGNLPASVKVYTDTAYISDDRALTELTKVKQLTSAKELWYFTGAS